MALKDNIHDRAQKFIQKGYLDKAIAEYRAAFELDPKDTSIRLRIGDLYIKTGKKDEAIKEYIEAAKANSQRGFYLKAIAVYKQVLKLDPTDIDVHNRLAELYTKQRLIADAISEYSFIVTVFERNGKTRETLELLKKMVNVDPENMGVRIKLAELHHRLSYKNEALAEYAFIFDRLVSQGKYDRAEKIYLGLTNSYPDDVEVLEKLSSLYKECGNGAGFYKYASRLLDIFKNSGETEKAKEICLSILEIRPDDAESMAYLSKLGMVEEAASGEAAPSEEGAIEHFSREETEIEELPRASESIIEFASDVTVKEGPSGEIEISLEGFDEIEAAKEEAAPDALKGNILPDEVKPAFEKIKVKAVEPEATGPGEEEREVEFELGSGALVPEVEEAAIKAPISEPAPEEPQPVQAEAAFIEVKPPEVVTSDEGVEAKGEEHIINEVEYVPKKEEAGIPSASITEKTAPVENARVTDTIHEESESLSEEERLGVERQAAIPEETIEETPAAEAVHGESESIFRAEEQEAVIESGVIAEEAPVAEGKLPPEALEETSGPGDSILDSQTASAVGARKGELAETGEMGEQEKESAEALESEDVQEELSKAISELMEKIDSEGAEPDNRKAEIIEEAQGEGAQGGGEKEEYIDLSAELGMEETVQNLAESWGKDERGDTFDEFKNGISKQLNKEDSETHYNLGIAYMEMELYSEAVKEFKIALKDSHLECDCYTRLGLCYMAMSNPDDAIMSYLKGLRVQGRSDEERMGMMYELALAYESTGKKDLALQLFKSIYDVSPDYREVSKKVKEAEAYASVPLDDGLIEVELL